MSVLESTAPSKSILRRSPFYIVMLLITIASAWSLSYMLEVGSYQRQAMTTFSAKGVPSAAFIEEKIRSIEDLRDKLERKGGTKQQSDDAYASLQSAEKDWSEQNKSHVDARSDFKNELEKYFRFVADSERLWKSGLDYEALSFNRLLVLKDRCGKKKGACIQEADLDAKWQVLRKSQLDLNKKDFARVGARQAYQSALEVYQASDRRLKEAREESDLEKAAILRAGETAFECSFVVCVNAATPYLRIIFYLAAVGGLMGGAFAVWWRIISSSNPVPAWGQLVFLLWATVAGLLAYFIIFVGGALIGLTRLDTEGLPEPQLVVALSVLAGIGADGVLPAVQTGLTGLLKQAGLRPAEPGKT
ncbi:MAG: hypothetical protein QM608_18015 [Caulobacter sp.]